MKNFKILTGRNLVMSITFFLLTCANAQQLYEVGLPSTIMNYKYAEQNNSQWCWAASIQMVLNRYDVNINQEQIVARSYGMDPYGNLPNWPGTFQVIHKNLNNWGIDNFGYPYTVQAQIGYGAPSPKTLIEELSNGRPIIIGYKTGGNIGHAVVVTAVSYTKSNIGPIIQRIVVRDPWPSQANLNNNGRIVYSGSILASKIQAFWYIRVLK